MHQLTKFFFIMLFLSNIIYVSNANSATLKATSCSRGDVQSAIDSAGNGDTVVVPDGNCAWGSSVTINKAITLKGSGRYSVNANHEDNGTWPLTITLSGNNGIEITGSSGDEIRVSGFYFTGSCPTGTSHGGAIYLSRSNESNSWRIDNCRFSVSGNAVRSEGNYGLIDHIYSYDPDCWVSSQICVSDRRNSSYGDWAFTQPVGFGGPNFVFIEDSTFWKECTSGSASTTVTDSQAGGKFVFRHNYVRDAMVVWHGTESGAPERGGYAFEIYDNEFYWTVTNDKYHCAILQRGGTALVYNNTATNYQALWKTWVRRVGDSFGRFGRCDVSPCNNWDGSAESPQCYACLDQPGTGKCSGWSQDLSDVQPQETSKVYIWNNTRINTGTVHHNTPTYVVEGRDYEFCDDSSCAPVGYTPYPYPHPLAIDDTLPPSPPLNPSVE